MVSILETLGLDVVAEAANGLETISLCKTYQPDLLILDVAMPHAGALEVLEEVRRWSSCTRVVVLTGFSAGSVLTALAEGGAHGMALKGSPTETIRHVIEEVVAGRRCMDEAVQIQIEHASEVDRLTRRETQVLGFLVRGYGNQEIADTLSLSPATVNNHRANLMHKLDVHSIAELMARVYSGGLLEPLKETP
jgi:DNA-binding NarL/FixJ family response regulator